jgi:hypothetical protein
MPSLAVPDLPAKIHASVGRHRQRLITIERLGAALDEFQDRALQVLHTFRRLIGGEKIGIRSGANRRGADVADDDGARTWIPLRPRHLVRAV